MDKRLVKAVAGLVVLGFVASLAPSSGQNRTLTIRYGSGDKAEARAKAALKLAGKLVGLLPGILEQFRARRRELVARSTADAFPRAEVASLLDSTEASLRKQFKKKELEPLRDYVAEVFDTARRDLGLSPKTALRHQPRPQAVFASLGLALQEEARGSLLDRVLGPIDALLVDLHDKATRKDLAVDLCVVSVPPEAKILLHSAAGRKIEPLKTNGRLENLVRGNYHFTLEKRRHSRIDCASPEGCPINLYDKKRPLLTSDFQDSGDYQVREGWTRECGGR
ncbi:MAG TPA: hypothetical protein VNW71_15755 [Thermoanaerobaculia bacterium]|nr:hypothetical protein [Thermoanaerobaculia bacterium]